jgi:CheY-like chemotaxis protein
MTQEFQDHLFEPFFGSVQPGKNTGLGLATVYAVVKQHGGQILCSSELGKGCTFEIFLPVAPASARAQLAIPPEMSESRTGAVILLVEDEEILREFGNLVLRKNGYQVLSARDGIEALTIAEQFPGTVDLLFTDVVMPRMGGPELSRRFAQKARAPVLFTSGYPRSILAESGLDQEAAEFLQKPYSTQALLLKIREVLARRQPEPTGK